MEFHTLRHFLIYCSMHTLQTQTNTQTHMHACTHACMHACAHTHTRTHTCTHACACTHACMHTQAHAHTHAHTCTHMHTHTHTHTHTQIGVLTTVDVNIMFFKQFWKNWRQNPKAEWKFAPGCRTLICERVSARWLHTWVSENEQSGRDETKLLRMSATYWGRELECSSPIISCNVVIDEADRVVTQPKVK